MTLSIGTFVVALACAFAFGMMVMLLAFWLGDRLMRDVAQNFTDHNSAPPRSSSPKR